MERLRVEYEDKVLQVLFEINRRMTRMARDYRRGRFRRGYRRRSSVVTNYCHYHEALLTLWDLLEMVRSPFGQ